MDERRESPYHHHDGAAFHGLSNAIGGVEQIVVHAKVLGQLV
jgi:hypothetical protein